VKSVNWEDVPVFFFVPIFLVCDFILYVLVVFCGITLILILLSFDGIFEGSLLSFDNLE